MFEIRHDEILTPAGVARWAGFVAQNLVTARQNFGGAAR
jgi:hypothetical protein